MNPLYHDSFPNTPGIYKITCSITGKYYVGSAVNLRKRRKEHFGSLQRNEHHNPKLQHAFNKYGPDAFTIEIVELVLLPEMLTGREQYWFSILKPFGKRGYNIVPTAGSSLGRIVSQASRDKSRATQLGRPSTRIDWKPTPEQVERQRQSLTGYKHTEQACRNMGKSHEGTKHSPEACEKKRLAAMGHAPTNAKTFILTSPDGIEYTVYGLPPFCREHGLNSSTIVQIAKGYRRLHKGWNARYSE